MLIAVVFNYISFWWNCKLLLTPMIFFCFIFFYFLNFFLWFYSVEFLLFFLFYSFYYKLFLCFFLCFTISSFLFDFLSIFKKFEWKLSQIQPNMTWINSSFFDLLLFLLFLFTIQGIDGLCTVLSCVVDFKGERMVGQTIIPGVLQTVS